MSDVKLRPLARARVRDLGSWSKLVATEVRGLMATCGAAGMTLWDIAAKLDCSRTALMSWRAGANEMPASKLLALRALAAEVEGKRRAV
jgi:hypothetical protein